MELGWFFADSVRRVGSAWGAPGRGERWDAARAPYQNRNPRKPTTNIPILRFVSAINMWEERWARAEKIKELA